MAKQKSKELAANPRNALYLVRHLLTGKRKAIKSSNGIFVKFSITLLRRGASTSHPVR